MNINWSSYCEVLILNNSYLSQTNSYEFYIFKQIQLKQGVEVMNSKVVGPFCSNFISFFFVSKWWQMKRFALMCNLYIYGKIRLSHHVYTSHTEVLHELVG